MTSFVLNLWLDRLSCQFELRPDLSIVVKYLSKFWILLLFPINKNWIKEQKTWWGFPLIFNSMFSYLSKGHLKQLTFCLSNFFFHLCIWDTIRFGSGWIVLIHFENITRKASTWKAKTKSGRKWTKTSEKSLVRVKKMFWFQWIRDYWPFTFLHHKWLRVLSQLRIPKYPFENNVPLSVAESNKTVWTCL